MNYNHTPGIVYTLLHWLVSAAALIITGLIVPGFKVKNFKVALIAAIIIAIANAVLWPILIFLTLPINIITLGLFTFVVNGMVLKICAAFLEGFKIDTWFAAIIGAIILSLVGAGMHYVLV
jgi:putative membrane protein